MKPQIGFNLQKFKNALAAALAALLMLSQTALPVYALFNTAETTGEEDTVDDATAFQLQIVADKSGGTPILTAGTKALIRFPFVLNSNCTGFIINVQARLNGTASDPMQFELASALQTANYINLNTLGYFDYELDVPITAEPGLHELSLELTYDSVMQNFGLNMTKTYTAQKTTLTYYYTVDNSDYDAIMNSNPLRITGSISPDSVKAGDVFSVGVTLQNDIPASVDGINVSIAPPSGFLLLNDASSKTVSVGADGTVDVSFMISASGALTSGEQQFTVKLSYENPGGKTFNVEYYMVVNAAGSAAEDADKNPAKVEIDSITLPNSAAAGDEFTAVVTLTNTSDKNAVIDELAVTNTLGLLNRTNAVLTGIILTAGESRSFEIKYYVPESTAAAFANFNVSLKYTTEGGSTQHTGGISGGMPINALVSPALSLTLSADGTVKVNGTFKVTAVIKNSGGDASNISVSVSPATGIVPKSQNKLKIDKLASGASYTCTFELMASKSTLDGYNLVGVDVNCGDIAITQYTGTDVDNPGAADSGEVKPDMPVIIIDSYDYGDEVYAGKSFTLTMNFKNTSKTSAIKDMKIVVQSADGTFTPTSSSNTFFVENFAASASITEQIDLSAKTDSKPLSFPISIVITYKNSAGDSGTSTEEITIPVRQEMRFNMGALTEIGSITTADSGYLTVSASNLG